MNPISSLNAWVRELGSAPRWRRLSPFLRSFFAGCRYAAQRCWHELLWIGLPFEVEYVFQARDYPGSRSRQYLMHLPRAKLGRRPRPLVVVLHGCLQDHHDIAQVSGFGRLARLRGFMVAYPFVTNYSGMRNKNCWGWWFDREIHAGAGEVEDLWQIIEEICEQYPVDRTRIHVAGLSSGAGMAVAMMVAHHDKIASGAAVAGVPYGEKASAVAHSLNPAPSNRPVTEIATEMLREMGEGGRAVPIQIVHSADDDKVPIQSAETIRDSWGYCFDVDVQHPDKVKNGQHGSARWEHQRFGHSKNKSTIETVFLEGPGHGWYGGQPGAFSFTDAPDIKRKMWRFFASHPLRD